MNRAQRNKIAKEVEKINRRYESKYFPKVGKVMRSHVSDVIYSVKNKGLEQARTELSNDLTSGLTDVVKSLYLEVGLHHARRTHKNIKGQVQNLKVSKSFVPETKGFGFNATWTAFILNYLNEFLTQKITFEVQETLRRKLLDLLTRSITEGWGIDKTVSKLEDPRLTDYQTARIVRTEINRAANVGNMAAVDTSEYEMQKEWIAAHDNRTRGNPMTGQKDHANHWDLDGIVVDYSDNFRDPRTGDLLAFPGDPKASAASTINCRCSTYPTAKTDENGRLVPRQQAAVGVVIPMLQRPAAAASPFSFNVIGKS